MELEPFYACPPTIHSEIFDPPLSRFIEPVLDHSVSGSGFIEYLKAATISNEIFPLRDINSSLFNVMVERTT